MDRVVIPFWRGDSCIEKLKAVHSTSRPLMFSGRRTCHLSTSPLVLEIFLAKLFQELQETALVKQRWDLISVGWFIVALDQPNHCCVVRCTENVKTIPDLWIYLPLFHFQTFTGMDRRAQQHFWKHISLFKIHVKQERRRQHVLKVAACSYYAGFVSWCLKTQHSKFSYCFTVVVL